MTDTTNDNIDDTTDPLDGADGAGVDPQDDAAAQDANNGDNDNGAQDDAGDDKPDPKVAAELRKLKRENQRLRRERNDARKATEKDAGNEDNSDDAEALRAELETARRDAADLRLQTAVERAASALKFHDPEDALALLDRTDIDVDPDTGKVDAESVKDALAELAERKPHLVNKGGATTGSGMGGGKQTGTPVGESVADRRARLGLGRRTEPIRFDRGGVVMPGSSDNRGLVQRAAAKSRKSE
jgi:hypothetical protein